MYFHRAGSAPLFIGRTWKVGMRAARAVVERLATEPGGIARLRAVLEQESPRVAMLAVDDAAVIETLAEWIARGQLMVVPPAPGETNVPPLMGEGAEGLPPEAVQPPEEEDHPEEWLEIVLVDNAGQPVPGAAYRVELDDGTVLEGYLDDTGRKMFEGLTRGSAKVTFPDLEEDDWKAS